MGKLEKSTISFISTHVPPLKSGKYKLSLNHKIEQKKDINNNIKHDLVKNKNDNSKILTTAEEFNKNKKIVVSGDRFTLPDKQIYKIFPPANTKGDYDSILPHIVFSRRTLPWERSPSAKAPANASWLALLVFAADRAPTAAPGTLAHLYPADTSDGGGLLESDVYSYGTATASGTAFLDYGQTSADPCVFLSLTPAQFASHAPSLADLRWNAHARCLTDQDGVSTDFAVVVATALPTPGTEAVVHLVSLEGLGDQLPQDDGSFATPPAWSSIRLVSLKSWRFQVGPLQASFDQLVSGLNGGGVANGVAPGDCQLRLPAGYAPAVAPCAPSRPLNSGYTVLADRKTNGAAWYRGPFAPSTVTPAAADSSWSSNPLPASQAAALDVSVKAAPVGEKGGTAAPTRDRGHAAAWQIGRLLALADTGFAMEQVAWKRDCRLALNRAIRGGAALAGRGSRRARADHAKSVLASASAIQGLIGAALTVDATSATDLIIPQTLVDWMGRLALLASVPFTYLVPDPLMLPPESIRFFSIDPRWVACLLDGAWSLDREPASRWAFDTAYQPWKQLLDQTLRPSFTPAGASPWPASGALLQSRLIPGYWPRIDFAPAPATTPLREERLGPDTLLLLFDQPFSQLTIQEPPEGIHFGFDMDEQGTLSKALRNITIDSASYPAAASTGAQVETQVAATVGSAADGVALTAIPRRASQLIQFDRLARLMITTLGVPDAQASSFTTAEFAMQMVESVPSVTLTLPPIR